MNEPSWQTRVEGWLKEQGYPLEMRVARAFRQRGWFLHHSRRYKDPNSSKEREIDILAFNDDPTPEKRLHGNLVIECKWTPKKPWVLFTAAQQSLTPTGHFHSTPMTETAATALKGLSPRDIPGLRLFAGIEEGYALVQAFSSEEAMNAGYAAVQAAIAAADFFAQDMSKHSKHAIVYVPTVVLEGEFFRCSLTETGDVDLEPLQIGVLLHRTATTLHRCVHIVRESALDEYISRASGTFDSLRKRLVNEPAKE